MLQRQKEICFLHRFYVVKIIMKLFTFIFTSAALAGLSISYAQESSATAAPNDAQIAMIAVTADNVDIDTAKVAIEKTSNKKVKDFAQLMVTDHTSVNDQATALAKKLGVTPEESDTSKTLKSNGDMEIAKLK